ncbi:MAG: PIN domain-containing protein [Candidatus Fibromonas sp.]|jgi:predicted nucleic acid-binding protein|nr:PIN domain-containing protein [Candidatus Fibromonas sp.]
MSGNVFLDTNIFIYTYSEDLNKKERSLKLLNLSCITSTQVLSELSNVCFKKLKFSDKEISTVIREVMDSCDIFIVNERTIQRAIFIKSRYGYSYYDSLILSSALESNCSNLYSEDLQHGQIVENSLKIVNPFV